MIEHRLPGNTDPKRIAAMSAAILGTGEVAAEALGHGRFLRSIIESDRGKILSTGAGPEAVLMALVGPECNVGLVLMAVERAGRSVEAVLAHGLGKDAIPTTDGGGRGVRGADA